MVILKLRRPFLIDTQWMPYGPFVWVNTVSFGGYTQPADYSADFDFETGLPTQTVEVGTVYIDNKLYDEAPSLATCLTDEESWFFDQPNQKLYVHVLHTKRMDSSALDTLKIQGFCSERMIYDSNGIEYLPLLQSTFKLVEKADRNTFEKMTFITNSAILDNSKGDLDGFGDTPTPGADAEILYIPSCEVMDTGNVPIPLYTGYARSDSIGKSKYKIKLRDKREQLNVLIPTEVFDSADFPNIDDDTEGLTIPEGYGDIKGAPAYCTNGALTSGNVNYKFATDATSITTVYVKTDDAWNSVTPVSTDPTNGEFVLSAANARDASGNYKSVKVDARFRDIDAPGDIMVDMISRYLGFPYTSEYFNQTQWEAEETYLDDIYLYIGEEKPFIDVIEELQGASTYFFKFRLNSAGKYTIKVNDIHRSISQTFLGIDNVDMETEADRNFDDYATSVVVRYNEDQESGRAFTVTDNTYEEDTFEEYRYYQKKTFNSNLTNSTDAASKAAIIAEDYSKARMSITIKLCCIQSVEIYDIISIDTRSYIDGESIRPFLGDRKIIVTETGLDFDNEKTTITGYDITEVV